MVKRDVTFLLSIGVGLLLFLTIASYAFYKTRDLVKGPTITIFTPQNGMTTTSSLIEMRGNMKNVSAVTLNDRKIFLDEAGNFKEKLLLSEGYNIITIKAEDRFKRTVEERLEIVFNKQ